MMPDALPLLFLAPMAGVTNPVFRKICKNEGADVVTSEFVSAEGILHRNSRTREYVEFDEIERPFGVQLFGADPVRLGEAARAVIDWVGPDFIDLNFGCPVNKVVCREGGSALLKNCPLLEAIAREVVRAVAPVPVTAKIRIGWDASSINAPTTARILEDAGISRIAVHGRTKEQGYGGEADWHVIAETAAAVQVPVIGNGDIHSAEIALKRWKESGVAGLMIGRAAMNAPWIFREIKAALRGEAPPSPPSLAERWERVFVHCEGEIAWRGSEEFAMRSMRSRLMAYSRGMPAGRSLRGHLSGVKSLAGLRETAAAHIQEHGAEAWKTGHSDCFAEENQE